MNKLSHWLLWLFLFLLPSQLGKHFFLDFSYIRGLRIDYLAPTMYTTDLLLIALVCLHWKKVWQYIRSSGKMIMGVGSLILLHIWIVQFPLLALYAWTKIIEVWLAYVLMRSIHVRRELVVSALLPAAALQFILVYLQFSSGSSMQGIFYLFGERATTLSTPGVAKVALSGAEHLRPYGTFSHPNSMGGFFGLVFIWTLTSKSYTSWTGKALGVFSGLLVLSSFSKTAIIATLITTLLLCAMHKIHIRCIPCFFVKSCVLGIIVLHFLSGKGDSASLEKRWELITQSAHIVQDNPLLGTGVGHHLFAQSSFPSRYPFTFIQPVHNIFILAFMQIGLLGSIILAIPLIGWVRQYWKRLIIPIIYICITGSLDHYWLTLQQNILLLGVMGGLLTRKSFSKE